MNQAKWQRVRDELVLEQLAQDIENRDMQYHTRILMQREKYHEEANIKF